MPADPPPRTVLFDDRGIHDPSAAASGRLLRWEDLRDIDGRRCIGWSGQTLDLPWVDQRHFALLQRSLVAHWALMAPAGHRRWLRLQACLMLRILVLWLPLVGTAHVLGLTVIRWHEEEGLAWAEAARIMALALGHDPLLLLELHLRAVFLIAGLWAVTHWLRLLLGLIVTLLVARLGLTRRRQSGMRSARHAASGSTIATWPSKKL